MNISMALEETDEHLLFVPVFQRECF